MLQQVNKPSEREFVPEILGISEEYDDRGLGAPQ